MKAVKYINSFVSLIIFASLILLPADIQASSIESDNSVLEANLQEIASAAMTQELNALVDNVDNQVQASSVNGIDSTLYIDAIQQQVSDAIDTRDMLMNAGIIYDEYDTELIDVSVDITDDEAILKATEYTVLNIQSVGDNGDAPDTTEYYHEHIFTFKLEDDQWKLQSNELVNLFGSGESETDDDSILSELDDLEFTETQIFLPIVIADGQSEVNASSVNESLGVRRDRVVWYALKYWRNYNGSYHDYSRNDCTNFVSQALKHGGWRNKGSRSWDSTSEWWTKKYYWWGTQIGSLTWINANNFQKFTLNQRRGYKLFDFTSRSAWNQYGNYFRRVRKGDILQADWSGNGTWNHTMIVTGQDRNGWIYLTYHDSDSRHRHILSIYRKNPDAKFRVLRMY